MIDGTAAAQAAHLLTLQFLAWVGEGTHGYAEAMEAWRSACPRLSIWEDAFAEGLVALDGSGGRGMSQARVILTPRGVARLAAAGRPTLRSAA
jgi:hypothetical protein